MPSKKVHTKISRSLTGKSCYKTNKIIDYPVRYLGRGHRILFHDPITAGIIGYVADGYQGAASGILHLGVDAICTKYPLVKKVLEELI